ncbi:MAG: hypothetical protein A2X89_05890 [Deltaproteobacteria bacterium GWD2_55_8]|nr:MAG: hypothetical protein A2X89_05890 [Deltaproteobacteria bacterium GWD2_55_8]
MRYDVRFFFIFSCTGRLFLFYPFPHRGATTFHSCRLGLDTIPILGYFAITAIGKSDQLKKEDPMKGIRAAVVVAFVLITFLGTGLAQEEKKAKQKEKAKKTAEVEAVISNVGQRTITYQFERKGKIREEVVGIDDQTYIERISRENIKLKDLQAGDKVYLRYEPDAYTPALSVQVIGKGKLKKSGGED